MLNNPPPAGYGTGVYAALTVPPRPAFCVWGVFRPAVGTALSKNSGVPDGPHPRDHAGLFAYPGEAGMCKYSPGPKPIPARWP